MSARVPRTHSCAPIRYTHRRCPAGEYRNRGPGQQPIPPNVSQKPHHIHGQSRTANRTPWPTRAHAIVTTRGHALHFQPSTSGHPPIHCFQTSTVNCLLARKSSRLLSATTFPFSKMPCIRLAYAPAPNRFLSFSHFRSVLALHRNTYRKQILNSDLPLDIAYARNSTHPRPESKSMTHLA